MPRTTTHGYTPAGQTRRLVLPAVLTAIAVAAVVGAFLLGRQTAAHPAAAAGPTGDLPMQQGIPVPTRDTQAGAATAAADYQIAGFRVSAGTLDPAAAGRVLLAPTATTAAAQVLAGPTAPATQLARARTSYVPLSLVVRSFTPRRAVVQVWGVAASSSQIVPQPAGTEQWGSSTVTMAWDGQQWRVADQTFADGPWPAPSYQRMGTANGDFSFRYSEMPGDGWLYVPQP